MEVSEVQWTRRMSSLHMCAPVCVVAHLEDRESVRDCRGRERETVLAPPRLARGGSWLAHPVALSSCRLGISLLVPRPAFGPFVGGCVLDATPRLALLNARHERATGLSDWLGAS